MTGARAWVLHVVFLAAASTVAAQVPPFEVASVKPDRSDRPTGIRLLPAGQVAAARVTLHDLILRAYGLHESQVVGGPDWMTSERFEVVARAAAPPPGGTPGLLSMLQALLVERFAMRVRTERRELPVYALLPERDDRRPGPNLRPSRVDCAANPATAVPNSLQLSADGWPPCGLTYMLTRAGTTRENIQVRQSAASISDVVYRLQPLVGRPVVDRTGLTGVYDVAYTYSTGSIDAGGPGDATVPDAPDVFTALREQLGLRLESRREAIDVLVIESAALVEN